MDKTSDGEDSGGSSERGQLHNVEARVMLDQLRRRMFGRSEPIRVGRFALGELLGRGAHGNVYLAEDVELKRQVAVKVLRTDRDTSHHARLLREAQALAQIKHPNVLTIYDVGVEDDRIFIAMEYVEEGTLSQWAKAHPPGSAARFSEVLRLAVGAARGLAVAHEAGIVHRDVKPANILVGADGRPRLADFGVARATAVLDSQEGEIISGSPAGTTTGQTRLTRTGSVIGTPMYMAPEQFDGRADEASDQWGLCAALWELAYGQRPFTASNAFSLSEAVSGPPHPPPKARTEVPGWWREILTRGLSPKADARWPSVGALADALEQATSRQRRRRVTRVGLGAVALGVIGVGMWKIDADRRRDRCERGADEIASTWNDDVRTEIHDAMLATELGYAQSAFDQAVPFVERYAEQWRGTYSDLCIATEVKGERPEPQWAASRACLDERREELGALLGVLSQDVDARTVENSVQAVSGLGRVEPCTDHRAPTTTTDPGDPDTAQLRRDYWSARALQAAGRYKQGHEKATALLERAAEHPSVRMRTRARQVTGALTYAVGDYDEARRLYGATFDEALGAGETDVALEAATSLAFLVGDGLEQHDQGLLWGRVARGLLTQLDREAGLEAATLEQNIGSIYQAQGKLQQAEQAHTHALELREQVLGPDHPLLADTLDNLAIDQAMQGRYDESLPSFERALHLRKQAFGPDHPLLASSYNNLGNLYQRQGKLEDAEQAFITAAEIVERALGPEHADAATIRGSLASLYTSMGRYDEAEKGLRATLEVRKRAFGPEHPDVAISHLQLGSLYEKLGRFDDGLKENQEALRLLRKAFGPDHGRVVDAHTGLGGIYRLMGKPDEAEREYLRAKEVLEASENNDAFNLGGIEGNLGNVYAAQGHFDKAVAAHTRALAIFEEALGPEHPHCGAAHLGLGTAHGAMGADDKAEQAYLRAKEIFEKTLGPDHDNVGLVYGNLGDVYRRRGEHEAARDAYKKSAEIVEAATGPDNPETALSLLRLAKSHLTLDERAEAAEVAKRALDMQLEQKADALTLAPARFVVARATWTADARPVSPARALAEQAAEAYRAAGEAHAESLGEVERWLAEHR